MWFDHNKTSAQAYKSGRRLHVVIASRIFLLAKIVKGETCLNE
jgi:hypothetical protein